MDNSSESPKITENNVSKVIAQVWSITTRKDGGGKITFEWGHDSLNEIQKLQTWNGTGEQNFMLAIVPFHEESFND